MAGQDGRPGIPERLEAIGGATLGLEVVSEKREAVVVEGGGEMDDVAADHEVADRDRLVSWSVADILDG